MTGDGRLNYGDGRLVKGNFDRHPLVLGFFMLWVCQMAGLLLHNFGTDAAGQAMQVSPLNSLMLAIPLYTCWVLVMAAGWMVAWMVLRPLRGVVTVSGVAVAYLVLLITQLDFGMQRYRGERISLVHFRTYLTPNVVNGDWLGPLVADPLYLASTLAIFLGGSITLTALLVMRARRAREAGAVARTPTWRAIALCSVGAAACYVPLLFAWYHQRDMVTPPQVVLARAVLHPVKPFTPEEESAQRTAIRELIDPLGRSRWISDSFPLMRVARDSAAAPAGDSPDIIFFVIESLRGRDVGYGMYPRAVGKSMTPHLDSLASAAVVFPRYIANGEPSPRGFITINTGAWEHGWGFIIANFPNLHADALPERLRARGYHTMALWGGNPSFDNQLVWARRWYDERIFGLPEDKLFYLKTTPDRVLMDRVINRIHAHDSAAPAQPFFAYVASNGTHTPYWPEPGAADSAELAAATTRQARYDLCLRNIDAQIGRVIAALKARPRWKNTVIVVIGDHSDRADEQLDERWKGMPVDALVWTAALMYGPQRLVGAPRRRDITASHVDLMPTVLRWVGDNGATAGMGMDLLDATLDSVRTAVAVNSRGYRMDRNGYTLMVDSRDSRVSYQWKAFSERDAVPIEKGPFEGGAAEKLSGMIRYWSQLVEADRVYREKR